LGWLQEVTTIQAAIEHSKPDRLIPCDDPAVRILHQLYHQSGPGKIAELIAGSLGDPANFQIVEKRSALIQLARSMGLRVPKSDIIANRRELAVVGHGHHYPCVLKRDLTWGGTGVRLVQREADLQRAWSWTTGWVRLLRAGEAGRRNKRLRTLLDAIATRHTGVELQEFLPGSPANRAVLCSGGTVVAGLSVLALQTAYPGGPASMVRVIDHPEMSQAARALVARLGLSGFCGFDFIVSPSGCAYLLELNPRVTPISHLAIADGTHLPAKLFRELTGIESTSRAAPICHDRIALFPTAWQRDPSESVLGAAYQDVPWDEPGLLAHVRVFCNWRSRRKLKRHRESNVDLPIASLDDVTQRSD